MAGAYVHIPFCKSRCKYCDFFSTTLLDKRDAYVQAVLKEIARRANYLPANVTLSTVYFGGGTPSLLTEEQIETLLRAIQAQWRVEKGAEITLEANPGDICPEKVQHWHEIGINRLSIGIQSFQDDLLQLIGRRHNAKQAVEAVRMAQQAGFDNISIDLMYCLPGQTEEMWKDDIEKALTLAIQHVSAYSLMYEEGTVLTQMLRRGEIEEADEDESNRMYDYLADTLREHGFVHYEVSNFALPGCESRHNSSYWDATPYIGLGAGAHSFDGKSRSWNVADLEEYINYGTMEVETLSEEDRYNELVMLSLRTCKGLDTNLVPPPFKSQINAAEPYIQRGLLRQEGSHLIATRNGLHILNRIIEDLMI